MRKTNIQSRMFLKGLGKKGVALILTVLIVVSITAVAVPAAFAANSVSNFPDCFMLYIDTRSLNSTSNEYIRVYEFSNEDPSWCYQVCFAGDQYAEGNKYLAGSGNNIGNNNDKRYIGQSGSWWSQQAAEATKVANGIYKFRLDNAFRGAVKIIRTNSSGSEVYNYINDRAWDYQRDKTVSDQYQNCIKMDSWSDKVMNWHWDTYTPEVTAGRTDTYTAQPDTTITDSSNLFPIKASFYDYYSDDEITNGWNALASNRDRIKYITSHGEWEPFQLFNQYLVGYHGSNVSKPLYFGNLYGKADGYKGYAASNLKNFDHQVNNSNDIGGYNNVVTGLTADSLNSSNNLCYYGGKEMPMFTKWIVDNNVGSIVNTQFPMRKETSKGITTYYFDSDDGKDSVYIYDNATKIGYAGNYTGKVSDALKYYGGTSNGHGFFPFDRSNINGGDARDYGFGMRIDVDFNLGSDSGHFGQIKGTNGSYQDQIFSFTGDDDVWVFVDNKLALDLGGDHKKAHGTINFHTGDITVYGTPVAKNNATRNSNILSRFANTDSSTTHTLTMFYMERGLSESNLSFNFNFSPVSNQLVTEKVVNTSDLNAGIKDAYAVTNADNFTFTSSELNGKTYTYGHTTATGARTGASKTVSDSAFNLGHKDTGTFNDQLTVGDTINVTESFPSTNVFTYDKTSWLVVDLNDNNSEIAKSEPTEDQSLDSSFTFKTKKRGTFDPTKLKLSYTNTPKKADVVIKKDVVDSDNTDVADNKAFTATVLLSFDKGSTYNAYPLKYYIKNNSTEQTMSGGQVTLQEGKDITIKDLPVGTYVKVTENAASLDGYTNTTGEVVLQVEDSGASTTITNKQPAPGEITKTIEGTKTLDGQNYNGRLFKFKLDGIGLLDGDVANAKDTSSTHLEVAQNQVTNGKFSFPALTFTEAGVYRYHVYEDLSHLAELDNNPGSDSTYASDIYQYIDKEHGVYAEFLVTITVTKNGTELSASDPVIVPYETTYPDMIAMPGAEPVEIEPNPITVDDFNVTAVSEIVFQNKVEKGSIEINKTNQADEKVGSVTFAIYKVDEFFLEDIDGMTDAEKYDAIKALSPYDTQTTNSNGYAAFENLDIYEAGYTRSSQPSYQYYALIETSSNSSYNLNKTPQIFKFPTYDAQEDMLKYHYTLDYVNGKLVNPNTSGDGMMLFKLIGIGIVGMSLLTLAGFVLYRKRLSFSFAKHIKK